jgi:hypothetical protein
MTKGGDCHGLTKGDLAMNNRPNCHCEERSDEAISLFGFKDEIATGSPTESPRNDKKGEMGDCHGFPSGSLAMTKGEIAMPPYGRLATMDR